MNNILKILTLGILITGMIGISSADAKEKKYSAYKQGVSVEITKVSQKQGKTVVELSMNNHRYDLSQMNVKEFSSLSGVKPEQYKIKGSRVGGHHLKAELTFNKEPSGLLIIGLTKDLLFEFEL